MSAAKCNKASAKKVSLDRIFSSMTEKHYLHHQDQRPYSSIVGIFAQRAFQKRQANAPAQTSVFVKRQI